MAAYELGRLVGWILFPLILGTVIYAVGRLATLRLEPSRQKRVRRGVAIGAITVTLVVAAINFSPLIKLGGDDVSRMSDRFLTGVERGCHKRCLERGRAEAKCDAFCACAAREVAKRATREDFVTGKVGASLQAKMAEAAQICIKRAPLH